MKNFNLLRKSERKSVGTTLALTVGSPSFDRRYSRLKHLAFMLLFLLGSLNVWGGETVTYQHVFTEKPSTGNSIDLSGVNWNVAATNLGSYNSQNYAGVQIGTSSKNGSITLTSSESWGYKDKTKITEVRLWLNLGGTSVTPTVTIGGKSATSDGTTVKKNSKAGTDWTKATKVTFTPAADGNTGVVVINVSTVKAGYICAMEIDCEPAAAGGGEGGTLSHTWDLTTNSYIAASTDQVTWSSTKDVENAEVKMIVEKGTAGTAANDYLGGTNSRTSSRFYQNSNLKIMHRFDVTITSVVFTAKTEADATALQTSDWSNAADATASGTTVTVIPNDGIIEIIAKIGGTCGFTGVTVNYTDASAEPEPVIVKTLKSIAVKGMTTTFEQGDVFNFDGTCTATYGVTKDGVPQEDENKTVTPTEVTSPDMSTPGEKEITVTYTENEVTKTTTYDITVSAALPKFIIDGEPLTTTATTEATTKTYTGTDGSSTVNIVFSDGAKKQAVGTGAVNNFSSNPAILIGKKGKNIHNSTPFPGKITKFELYYNKGAANSTSISVTFSTTPLTEAATSGDNLYTVTFTDDTYKDKVYDCTSKVPEGALYFWYQVTSNSNSQVQFRVTYEANPTAPSVTIDPTAISLATPDAANGTIDATYENIDLEHVSVGCYNDAECTEAFAADWLTATLNGDKDIEYTIAANTGAARTAYIKLTASASNGTSPDVVKIIEVSQAKGIPTYTALDAIFAAATGTNETVNITFDNWVISAVKGNNAYLTDGTYGLIIYTEGHGFEVGNVLSGTAQTLLKLYQGNAQLSGLKTTTTGLTVTKGGTVTARVLDVAAVDALTGANAGSLIKISGECTKESSKYYIQGIQLYNSLYSYEEPTAGNVYDCTGIFLMFNSTKEICPREGDLVPSAVIPTAVITFEDFSIEKGQNTTLAATVAPAVAASAEVTYSIVDGGEYVSLEGATTLTANEIGTAHIRATVADNLPNYYGATKDITVTVTAPDSRKKATLENIAATSGTFDRTDITYAAYQGDGTTPPAANGADLRLYKPATGKSTGGYIVISAVKGCTIDEVVVTNGDSKATKIGCSITATLATSGEAYAKNASVSFESLNSSVVYIDNIGSDRMDIIKIEVYYTGDPLAIDHYFLGGTYETTFEQNGTFNYTGLKVYASYDAGETITEEITGFVVEADLTTAGSAEAIVKLNDVELIRYDITVTAGKENPALAYTPESVTITAGDAWSAPTLSNTFNVSPITYSSDKPAVATVDAEGNIALAGGCGTAVITASFAGDDDYIDSEATFTITVNEPAENLSGTWNLVTDAAELMPGMQVIIANIADENVVKTMGQQNSNNRAAVASTVAGTVLTPAAGTKVFTLVDAGNGKYALQLVNGKYLCAASSSSNNLKEQTTNDANGQWTITIADGKATITAQGSYSRKLMRFNPNNGNPLFACYAENSTTGTLVTLYAKPFDYTRNVSGNYATICLPKAGKIIGATLYEIAYYGETSKKIFFDEIVNGEMEAGIPYIFQPAAGVEKINVYYSDNTAENVGAGNRNGLIGFYDLNNENATLPLADNASLGNYILYQNAYWLVSGRAAYIANYRAYIRLADITPSEPTLAPGRRRISMSVNDTQTTTGFENAEANEAPRKVLINGELFILRGEKMYDAKGQMVK